MKIYAVIINGSQRFRGTYKQCQDWLKNTNDPKVQTEAEIEFFAVINW